MTGKQTYTLAEIDEMRSLVRDLLMRPVSGNSWIGTNDDTVERKLRTYMMGGVTVADLRKRAEEKMASDRAYMDRMKEWEREQLELERPQREAREARALELKAKHYVLDCMDVVVSRDSYRCACCGTAQAAEAGMVFVLEGTKRNDPVEVTRQKHLNKGGNYRGSAWCLACVPKEPVFKKKAAPVTPETNSEPSGTEKPVARCFWSRFFFGPWS